jgi:hypothetical protein
VVASRNSAVAPAIATLRLDGLLAATAIAAVVATGIDLAIQEFARSTFAVPREFEPFQGTVAPYTIGGVVLAAIAFWIVSRFSRDLAHVYTRLAIGALLLSWIPDLALLAIHEPGASVPAVASLMTMHAAAAAIVTSLLLRLGVRRV